MLRALTADVPLLCLAEGGLPALGFDKQEEEGLLSLT